MKKIIFAFIFMIVGHLCKSQEIAKAAFLYTYKHQIDTSRKHYYYTEKMVLLQGEKTSIYKSYDAYLSDSTLQAKISENGINITGMPISAKPVIRDMILKNFEKNTAVQIRNLLEYYYWEENLYKINWQIFSDTTNMKGLKCQKATCEFKGRDYTAWFSNEIISNNGPWKFGGLPGLILTICDNKNEIIFEFEGYASLSNLSIALPVKSHLSSAKEYNKIRDAYLNDPISFLQNNSGIAGNLKLTNMTAMPKTKKTINNPIELKDE